MKSGADIAIKRPDEMATDTAPKLPAIRHCLEQAIARTGNTPDIFVDLDVTSPLRLPPTSSAQSNCLRTSGARNVITGAPAHRSPYFNLVEARARRHRRPVQGGRSADRPPAGCAALLRHERVDLCLACRRIFAKPAVFYPDTRLFEMPQERSVDIDSDLDFTLVELLLRKRLQSTGTKP